MLDFMKKKKVTVRVPATSANIGPGFDSFACALSLYNTITFELCGSTLAFEGCDEAFRNRENLAYRGYELAMKKMGLSAEDGLKITIDADVPVCRGLGSSSTLIVAGAMAANELHDKKLSRMEILEVANEIEGHPDNVAAAIAGGLTASMLDEGKPYTVKYRMHEDIHTVVVIPDFELSTTLARGALPQEVPFKDAVFNLSHAALLLRALELGDEDMIKVSLKDRLHQDFRKKLIPGYAESEKFALELGAITYCISGAGSTQLALVKGDAVEFADRLREKIHTVCPGWTVLALSADNDGVKVVG